MSVSSDIKRLVVCVDGPKDWAAGDLERCLVHVTIR